jgi:hypothetical protein
MTACTWKTYGSMQTGFAPCASVYWHLSTAYNFCPFCGQPLKIIHSPPNVTNGSVIEIVTTIPGNETRP